MLECATINRAKAFCLNSAIRVGGLADIALVNMDHLLMISGHDIVSDLVYSLSGQAISDLICNGQVIMRDRVVKDEERIMHEFKKRAKYLKKSAT